MSDPMENAEPKPGPMNLRPPHPGVSGWDLIVGSIGVLLWLGVAWLVAISIPRGERLFADWKMAIPLFTQMVIRFGQWAVPVLASVSLLMCLKVRKRWAWLWFLMVLPAFIICAVFVSLYIPITQLLGALGPNAGWWDCF
jgi:type II secretory pathway component PulF